jgi:hypothetical protein
MEQFSKADIGKKVMVIADGPTRVNGCCDDFEMVVVPATIVDVALNGSKMLVESSDSATIEIESTKVFRIVDDFMSYIKSLPVVGYCNNLYFKYIKHDSHIDVRIQVGEKTDDYGNSRIAGVSVKYGEVIPDELYEAAFVKFLHKICVQYCGVGYAVNYDNWGSCPHCSSSDVEYDSMDLDNVYDGGEYVEYMECRTCGCRFSMIYRLTKDRMEIEQ